MKKTFFYFLILTLYIGCSDNEPVTSINPFIEDYTSILSTDEFGNIIGGDTTDWCFEPCDSLQSCNRLLPAFPNPVNDTVNIRFDVDSNHSFVKLYFLNSSTDTLTLFNDYLQSGSYWFRQSKYSLGLSNIYKRIYIEINDFTCYGDIRFN